MESHFQPSRLPYGPPTHNTLAKGSFIVHGATNPMDALKIEFEDLFRKEKLSTGGAVGPVMRHPFQKTVFFRFKETSMKVASFTELEATNLSPIDQMITSVARKAYVKARQELDRHTEGIIRTGYNFYDLEEQKQTLRDKIEELAKIQRQFLPQQKALKKQVEQVKALLYKGIRWAYKKHDCSPETLDRLEQLDSRLQELRYDLKELDRRICRFGRMGKLSCTRMMKELQRKLDSLEHVTLIPFLNMERNKGRFLSIYDNPNEVNEITAVIRGTMYRIANRKLMTVGRNNVEEYFFETLSQITPDDFEFRPFEHVSVFNMDKLDTDVVRKCFYSVVIGKVMKFAKTPLDRLYRKISLMSNFSEFDEEYLQDVVAQESATA